VNRTEQEKEERRYGKNKRKKKNRKVVVVFFFPPSPSPPSAERKSANPDEISSGAGRWPREPIGCHWSPREWAGPTLGSLRSTKREGGRKFQKKKKGKKSSSSP
jgi:hypothetical protein